MKVSLVVLIKTVSSASNNEGNSPIKFSGAHFTFRYCIKSSIKDINKIELGVAPWRIPERIWNSLEYAPLIAIIH